MKTNYAHDTHNGQTTYENTQAQSTSDIALETPSTHLITQIVSEVQREKNKEKNLRYWIAYKEKGETREENWKMRKHNKNHA